ncbi:hypothetical protein ACH5RR_026222 [Cinchona calisaya]|uniref:SWIM-type domain-containing protein n=1 Tax=Cinchona calisaya TaxID=153742 RepID=A0ABD2Z5A4_9GENT
MGTNHDMAKCYADTCIVIKDLLVLATTKAAGCVCSDYEEDGNKYIYFGVDCEADGSDVAYNNEGQKNDRIEIPSLVEDTFVEAMDMKKPMSMMADGDKAKTWHRLCSWHINKNAQDKVRLVAEFGLHGNDWVQMIYEDHMLWAEAYVRGQFFGCMRSTQRSEKMNAFLNRYLHEKMRLFKFVTSFDLVIAWLRHNEAVAVHETEDTTAMMTTSMVLLVQHASQVYTRNVFYMDRKHLNRQALIIPVNIVQSWSWTKYILSKYKVPGVFWTVEIDRKKEELKCSGMKFESKGIPCVHMFRILIQEEIGEILASLIMHRSTRQYDETKHGHNYGGVETLVGVQNIVDRSYSKGVSLTYLNFNASLGCNVWEEFSIAQTSACNLSLGIGVVVASHERPFPVYSWGSSRDVCKWWVELPEPVVEKVVDVGFGHSMDFLPVAARDRKLPYALAELW